MKLNFLHRATKWRQALIASLAAGSLLLSGCGSSDDNFAFIGGGGGGGVVVAAPTATNDTFNQILANTPTTVTAAQGVLTNDTVNGATITAFTNNTTAGGTVVVNADGSFTYTPPFPVNAVPTNDTFTYTLTNASGTSTGTVTLTITARAFFVDNSAAAGGNGAFNSRFQTIAQALAAAVAGDTIFVFRGNGNNYAAFTIPANVTVLGEGAGFVFNNGINPREINAQTIVPAGQVPNVGGNVTLNAANSTLSGFNLQGGAGLVINGVSGTTNVSQVTVNAPATGIALSNSAGTLNFTNVDITGATVEGINISNTNATLAFSQCDLVNNTSNGIDINTTQGTFTFDQGTFNNFSGRGIVNTQTANNLNMTVSNTTFTDGALNAGDGIFCNLSGTATCTLTSTSNTFTGSGAAPFANSLDNAIQVAAAGTSTATVTATGNTATSCGAGYSFDSTGGTITANLTNCSINGSGGNGFQGTSTAGPVTVTLNNCDTTAAGADGFCFASSNAGTFTATLTNGSDSTNAATNGLQAAASGTGTSALTATGSNVTGAPLGLLATSNNTSTLNFVFTGGTATSTNGGAVLNSLGTSTLNANVSNNTNLASTAANTSGLTAVPAAGTTLCLRLAGNTATGGAGGFGYNLAQFGTFNLEGGLATVQGNNNGTFNAPGVYNNVACPLP